VSQRGSGRFIWAGKLLLGVGLILVITSWVDVAEVRATVKDLDWWWLAVMVALPHLGIVVSAEKWRLLLGVLGTRVGWVRASSLYLVGTFFNNFLPTTAGGDVVRSYQLGKEAGFANVAAATFVERLIGLGALMLALGLPFASSALVRELPLLREGLTLLVLVYCAGVFLVVRALRREARGRSSALMRRISPIRRVFEAAAEPLRSLLGSRRSLSAAFGLSVVFYGIAIATVYAGSRAIGQDLPWSTVSAAVPLVLALGIAPVSVNGLGVSEAGYVFTLSLLGMPSGPAFALALLLRLRIWFTGLLGGLVFLALGDRSRAADAPRGSAADQGTL
jgi:glycosyltransferase 2 family protein